MFTTGANAPEVVNQVDRKKPALSGEENLLLLWLNAYRAAPHYPEVRWGIADLRQHCVPLSAVS